MVMAFTHLNAVSRRRLVESAGNGEKHWRSDYIGHRGQLSSEPEAFLIEMSPSETLLPHFHAVDQFQIFVAGSGELGRQSIGPLTVHYADHHTAYGPIVSSPFGLSYFTLRPSTDPGAKYLNKPGYREALRPSVKRHSTQVGLMLSTEPVLGARSEVSVDPLLQELAAQDGLGAFLFRMGPSMKATGADPSRTSGQYYLVLNGSIVRQSQTYPMYSLLYVANTDTALELTSGPQGAEVLLMEFTRRDE
jgi:hypothetical protein